MSVNKVILVGRLGQNPEVRYTPAGAAVANFSVATNESWMDKSGQKQEKTEWHKIVVWGKIAELCNQYLSKGRQVYLEGRLQTRQWQDKDGQTKFTTEINAQTVQFLGGAGTSPGAPGGDRQAPSRDNREGGYDSMPGMSSSGPSASSSNGGGGYSSPSVPPQQGFQPSPPHPMEGTFTEDDIPF